MKKFRKICKNPFVLSFVCSSFLLLGFSRGNKGLRSMSTAELYHTVSAKDVFRSVVFADGPLTSKIASLKKYDLSKRSLTSEQMKEYKNMEDHIMSNLGRNNPNYFENFKNVINSQDLNSISTLLENVSKDVLLFLEKEKEASRVGIEDNLKSYEGSLQEPIGVKDAEMIAEPLEGIVLVGIVVVAAILFVLLANSPETPSELIKSFQEKSLTYDKLVVDVSNMLS